MAKFKLSFEGAADAARYTFRAYQDLIKDAIDGQDAGAVRRSLSVLDRLFHSFIEKPTDEIVEVLDIQLANVVDDKSRSAIREKITEAKARKKTADDLEVARQQVLFGLAAYALDRVWQGVGGAVARTLYDEIAVRLPQDLRRLITVFTSLKDRAATEYWGWDWWDLPAEGEASFIDVHTKPNRLFCVQALRQLERHGSGTGGYTQLPLSHGLAFLADPGNNQGLMPLLGAIESNPAEWVSKCILTNDQVACVPRLKDLLTKAKKAEEEREVDQLIAAKLSESKVEAFRTKVLQERDRVGRFRALFAAYDLIRDENGPSPPGTPMFGFNQIDDKGAFVEELGPRGYAGWGEAYGEGMARTEDVQAWQALLAAATELPTVPKSQLMTAIEQQVKAKSFREPIVVHSMGHFLEMEQVPGAENFVPRYRPECPVTAISALQGFMGVLRLAGMNIALFDAGVRGSEIRNKVLVVELAEFMLWKQYLPVIEEGDEAYVRRHVYMSVSDLNENDALRGEILGSDPEWLKTQVDKERYLRARVIVLVRERIVFEVLDSSRAIALPLS